MKTLAIRFSSPLQSFGNEATFSRRTSWDYPSKSAIIGFLSAAMGYRRNDTRINELNVLNFAVRVDQPGRLLSDYQTVEWKPNTRKITYRDYLQDAVYVVAVGGEDGQFIENLANAIKHPKFQLFFGRRANVPAGPLHVKLIDDQNPVQVLKSLEWQASKWFRQRARTETVSVEVIADANLLSDSNLPSDLTKDQVISFDQRHRQFGFRGIRRERVKLDNDCFKNGASDTDHDIMDIL